MSRTDWKKIGKLSVVLAVVYTVLLLIVSWGNSLLEGTKAIAGKVSISFYIVALACLVAFFALLALSTIVICGLMELFGIVKGENDGL